MVTHSLCLGHQGEGSSVGSVCIRSCVAAFDKLRQEAIKSGKTVGDLGKDSKQSAQVIEDAFGSTASGIAKSMTDAAKGLSDTLAKMDANLTAAIGSLQTAMVTMINDLISVILGIPGCR